MEGLPKDIFDHDVKTFPTKDSEMAAKLDAQRKKAAENEQKEKAKRGRPPKSQTQQKSAPPPPTEPVGSKRKGSIAQKTQKIRLYFHYLSHKISFAEPKPYPQTHDGLDEVLDKIECQLHGEGGIEKAGVLYVSATAGLEELTKIINPLGWQLSGPAVSLKAAVAANEEKWKDLVKEFAIENASWFMFGPTKRLLFTTIQLVMAVDNANKMAGLRTQSAKQAPVPEDVAKEAEDL